MCSSILIGWPNLAKLGVIPADFPACTHSAKLVYSNDNDSFELLKREFPDEFSSTLPDTPIKGPPMKINLTGNVVPFKAQTTKATPHHWKEEADRVLNDFLAKGVIEPVPLEEPSDWVSPAFFVPKDDSPSPRLRLVTDFSRLNRFVK